MFPEGQGGERQEDPTQLDTPPRSCTSGQRAHGRRVGRARVLEQWPHRRVGDWSVSVPDGPALGPPPSAKRDRAPQSQPSFSIRRCSRWSGMPIPTECRCGRHAAKLRNKAQAPVKIAFDPRQRRRCRGRRRRWLGPAATARSSTSETFGPGAPRSVWRYSLHGREHQRRDETAGRARGTS